MDTEDKKQVGLLLTHEACGLLHQLWQEDVASRPWPSLGKSEYVETLIRAEAKRRHVSSKKGTAKKGSRR